MPALTNIEKQEVKRILFRKVGSTYVSTQKDMEYLLSKYIKCRKGVSVVIETLSGMDEYKLSLFPDAGVIELKKLSSMYDIAHGWFLSNKDW